MRKFKFFKKEGLKKLPKNPGVYAFKKGAKLLYIGKASNIRERVKNHFKQPSFKESVFLKETKKIGFIITDSEIEALILEAHLIKKVKPKYNVIWKDDKNYFFVGITKEDFPRVFWTHQPELKTKNPKLKTDFVGPFVDGKALKKTLKILRRIFPYRSCKKLPKRPCLWYQLARCPAPCLLKSELGKQLPSAAIRIKRECQKNAKSVIEILRGRKTQVLKNLRREMKQASELKDFEKAARIRNKIFALDKTISNARIFEAWEERAEYSKIEKNLRKILKTKRKIKRIEAYDISNIFGKLSTGAMVTFIDGRPNKKFYRKFKIKISGKPNDVAMIKEVLLRRLNHLEWGWPDLILIDGGRAQLNAALSCLTSGVKQVKVMAIAKKKNELYLKGRKPILLKSLPRGIFNLILQLRDEAHRFAITYHKKLRKKELVG